MDSGAQVSIISTGLVAYLKLQDTEGAAIHPAKFTVAGFDGVSKGKLPILEVWMRFKSRGDNVPWDKV